MDRSLIEKTPWKGIGRFMIPVLVGLLLQQLYNTVDTIVVGNFLGQDALSAVGTTSVLTLVFLAIANGFSAGGGVVVAQLFGAEKKEELRHSASTSLILLLLMGVLSTVLALAVSRIIIQNVIACPADLVDMAVEYFNVYALGLIFQFGYNIIAGILRGVGDSKASMYFLIVASVLNIFLDIFLIAICKMGVAGAAVATGISQGCCMIAALIYMVKKYPIFKWKLKEFTFERKWAGQTLKLGLPMALQQFIVSIGFIFLQRGVNSYGKFMTASYTVGMRIELYMLQPCSALQVTQATYTGQNLGAGKMERIYTGAKQTIILSECMTAVISALIFIFAPAIIGIFGISGDASVYCLEHVRTSCFVMFVFAGYFPLLGLFQGAGDGFKATLVATLTLVVRVFTMYVFCYIPIIGYRIVWLNGLFGFMLGMTLTYVFFLKGSWKKNWV